jgi:hypothetical protein
MQETGNLVAEISRTRATRYYTLFVGNGTKNELNAITFERFRSNDGGAFSPNGTRGL